MILIWFIYGLAFFVLGLVILVYPKKGSTFELARSLWLVGAFGILHGVNEWLDMFIELGGVFSGAFVASLRLGTLAGSFVLLLCFGVAVVRKESRWPRAFYAVVPVLVSGFLILFLATAPREQRLQVGDTASRYLLCVPGAFLAGLGLFFQRRQFHAMNLRGVARSLAVSAVVFLAYGVLAGLMVKKADFFPAAYLNQEMFAAVVGFPVQVLRAACAVVLAFSMIHILGIFHWETQETLRASERRYTTIASAMPVFLFMTDRNLVVTFVQGKGLGVLGLEPERVCGRPIGDVLPSGMHWAEDCRQALSGKEFVKTASLDGRVFEVYYSALRDNTAQVTGVAGVALDVSAKMQAERELETYKRRMEQHARQAEVGMFSSTMARQLAEPLSVTRLMLEAAAGELSPSDVSAAAREGIRKSLAEMTAAQEILKRFMALAHLGSATPDHPVGLYQIAKRMMVVFAESARRRNVSIAIKDMDAVPLTSVSPREIEQIFYHLIQRVVDIADPGSETRLTLSCLAADGHVELLFADTCGGIEPGRLGDLCDQILADPDGVGGGGLGLAVIERIVTSHGGEITIEAEPGQGTTFRVKLPAKRVY